MIFPIRPTTTEPRRIDDVSVRATPAVTGITAARGFNQPGVVVTIGDGARTLARSGQQPRSEEPAQEGPLTTPPADSENVFETQDVGAGVESVFGREQTGSQSAPTGDDVALGGDEREAGEEPFNSVWESDVQSEDPDASGVPYAALQRAASVQDLDVGDVAKALANTQIAVRVLATQEKPAADASERVEADSTDPAEDVETSRLSSLPTDGVPYEALQRAVTEAENAQTAEASEANASLTEPVFLPPENGGAPWGRAVPFVEESSSVLAQRDAKPERAEVERRDRASETQAQV